MILSRASMIVLVSLCGLVAGCGESNQLVQATGSITVDGKPAEGAVLLFHPESDGELASGEADATGSFALTSNMRPGIAPGRYRVTASWPDPSKRATKEDLQAGRSDDAPDLLQGKYVQLNTTTLSAEITPQTSQIELFELTTK